MGYLPPAQSCAARGQKENGVHLLGCAASARWILCTFLLQGWRDAWDSLPGTEGCAQTLSHQREVSDVKRSSSGNCSGPSAEKTGKHSGCSLGCKVTEAARWWWLHARNLGGRGLAHSQGQVLIQQHKVAEVPGLLSLQEMANASTMEQSGVLLEQ